MSDFYELDTNINKVPPILLDILGEFDDKIVIADHYPLSILYPKFAAYTIDLFFLNEELRKQSVAIIEHISTMLLGKIPNTWYVPQIRIKGSALDIRMVSDKSYENAEELLKSFTFYNSQILIKPKAKKIMLHTYLPSLVKTNSLARTDGEIFKINKEDLHNYIRYLEKGFVPENGFKSFLYAVITSVAKTSKADIQNLLGLNTVSAAFE